MNIFKKNPQKDLVKIIIILNIIVVVIITLITIFGALDKNLISNTPRDIHDENQVMSLAESPFHKTSQLLGGIYFFAMPLLVVLLSIKYILKNPQNYGKSLMIPISYIIVSYFLILLWAYIVNIQGEEGMIFLYIYAQFAATFILVSIINYISEARSSN